MAGARGGGGGRGAGGVVPYALQLSGVFFFSLYFFFVMFVGDCGLFVGEWVGRSLAVHGRFVCTFGCHVLLFGMADGRKSDANFSV